MFFIPKLLFLTIQTLLIKINQIILYDLIATRFLFAEIDKTMKKKYK